MDSLEDPPFREVQLVRLLAEILRRLHPEAVVEDDLSVGQMVGRALRMDIVLFENDVIYAVDVKGIPPQTSARLEELLIRLDEYRDAIVKKYRTRVEVILAIPGELTPEKVRLLDASGVGLWDRSWISNASTEVGLGHEAEIVLGAAARRFAQQASERRQFETLPPPPSFQAMLQSVPPGKPGWSQYQKLCRNIFEHLFCPPLSSPIEESSNEAKVNRRDFVVPNYANDGFWMFLRTHYRADYVVVDAKNLTGMSTKNHVLQVCNYMTPHGTGLFGVIITRKGTDRAADYTRREQWVLHGKMVIVLSDDDILQMLNNHDAGDDPAVVIRQKIEDFRLAM
jgi:hypothetical protein